MDAETFDRLVRTLTGGRSRRGLLSLLAMVPLASTIARLLPDEADAAGRRKRRKKRHKHQQGDGKDNRNGKQKGGDKGKHKCTPEPEGQTCAGKCGIVTNKCGGQADCGPCTCATGCPQCLTCNAATGQCVPLANGTACDDGNACTQTDTCQGGVCVGSNPVTCPTSPNECENPGTCNPATGLCSGPTPKPNRTPCSGGNICCNGTCCSGCCGTDGSCGVCLAFVTSTTTPNGNLGGLSGADLICQQLADTAGLPGANVPGTYLAWLSDVTGSPSSRFRQSQMSYARRDGQPVANNWGDLTDGFLINPINWTELNTVESTSSNVWTNTTANGAPATTDLDCSDWTSDAGDPARGRVGDSVETNTNWTGTGSFRFCSTPGRRLYCFQQR